MPQSSYPTTYYTLRLADEQGELAVYDYSTRVPSHSDVNAKLDAQPQATMARVERFEARTSKRTVLRTYTRGDS